MNTLLILILILTGAYTLYCSDGGIEVVENTKVISQQGDEHNFEKVKKLFDDLNIDINNILNIDKEEIERFLNTNKNKIKIMMNFLEKKINDKDIDKSNKDISKDKEYISFIVHKKDCNCSLEKNN